MTTAVSAVKVMNGEVAIGDTIAYAVRQGSSLDMNIATVLAVTVRQKTYSKATVPILRVQVIETTSWRKPPYETTVGVLSRVVKL